MSAIAGLPPHHRGRGACGLVGVAGRLDDGQAQVQPVHQLTHPLSQLEAAPDPGSKRVMLALAGLVVVLMIALGVAIFALSEDEAPPPEVAGPAAETASGEETAAEESEPARAAVSAAEIQVATPQAAGDPAAEEATAEEARAESEVELRPVGVEVEGEGQPGGIALGWG